MRTPWTLVALSLVGGCGTTTQIRPTQQQPTPISTRTVALPEADFVLTITNQSFGDPNVTLDVRIDGTTVVNGTFAVEGQHNFIMYPLKLGPGSHELTARSDSGAQTTQTLALPATGKRYGVLSYWSDVEDPTRITWQFQSEPPVFG